MASKTKDRADATPTDVASREVSKTPEAEAPVIAVYDLEKSFGSTKILDGVDLEVRKGQLFGLIGPSGCGKTMLVRMLVGLLGPTKGTISVLGVDPQRFGTKERQRIGYMAQSFNLHPTLTVKQNASFVAGIYGVGWLKRRKRIQHLLEFLELWDARNRSAGALSGGMRRRLQLACALVHEPAVLFVDEPTAGLDPLLRAKTWDYLRSLKERGMTIVLTTQYIDEAAFCDAVAIMDRGRIVASGTPSELREQALAGELLEIEAERFLPEDISALRNLSTVKAIEWKSERVLRVTVVDVATATPQVTKELQRRGVPMGAIRPEPNTFDEVFTRLVSRRD